MVAPNIKSESPYLVLMADDDPDDIALVADALVECAFASEVRTVPDGHALLEYLQHRGPGPDFNEKLDPDLILLDINMPKRNGIDVLGEIKQTAGLSDITVVILTTSHSESDYVKTAALGADGYITKPNSYRELVDMMRTLHGFRGERRRDLACNFG